MANIEENQATLAQEGCFELVEHSDASGDQCQEATIALTNMERKVRELEQRLEEEIEKAKTPPALKPITLVLMWIHADEIRHRHEGDSALGGEQAARPTAAEAHEQADESFQAFKLWMSQHKNEKAVLHDVANLSQLESACLKPFDEDGTNFARTPDGKLECQDTFYLSLGIQHSSTEDNTKDKARHELLLNTWKDFVPHYEHIVVWHLNNDDRGAVLDSLWHRLSKQNKFILLGRSYLAPCIKRLVKKENRKAGGLAATSEPSTAKPVSSSMRTEQSPAGVQSTRATILGSNHDCSSEAKPTATASNGKDLKSTEVHEGNIEPQDNGSDCADRVDDILTKGEGALLLGFVACTLAGWVYGGYAAACYIKTLISGFFH